MARQREEGLRTRRDTRPGAPRVQGPQRNQQWPFSDYVCVTLGDITWSIDWLGDSSELAHQEPGASLCPVWVRRGGVTSDPACLC